VGSAWYAFLAPLGLNAIEGSEAALLVASTAARAGWRRALTAAAGGMVVLGAAGVALWFAYAAIPDAWIDYGAAAVIFAVGVHELWEGLEARGVPPHERAARGVWPAFVGVVTEGGEALVFTFAAGSSFGWSPAAVGGAVGFALPWTALGLLRRAARDVPAWKQEVAIGVVLVVAATSLAALRASGILH
jgi:uncharacterized membrane protein